MSRESCYKAGGEVEWFSSIVDQTLPQLKMLPRLGVEKGVGDGRGEGKCFPLHPLLSLFACMCVYCGFPDPLRGSPEALSTVCSLFLLTEHKHIQASGTLVRRILGQFQGSTVLEKDAAVLSQLPVATTSCMKYMWPFKRIDCISS